MKKTALISLTIILILSQTTALASTDNTEKENKGKIKSEEVKKNATEENNDDEKNSRNKVYVEKGDKYSYMLKTNDTNFMIKGIISSFDSSTIVIFDKTVKIDKTVTHEYKEEGKPEKGMFAMVQGIIKDNTYYATKLVVNNRNKWEVFPKPTSSESAKMNKKDKQASDNLDLKNIVKEYKSRIKQTGSVNEVITFLEQLLNKVKELKK